ncbi:hypothetical protein RJ639_046016 [Escallonia herrerae]|uniref:Protein NRDE2 homolog n=1 Tax=Escallonia herrerae TaxID=1293975 RepID=A0AA89B0P2_9ASTE|nr:hypothetical protein RJ639_046016 [Escallonia herrerae]
MDIARYKHYKSSKLGYFPNFHRKQGSWGLEGDNDINALDAKLKSAGRYWSAKYAALERHKNFKRIRIVATERPASMNVSADFIPVSGDQMSASVEESWEDEVLRRTREFNRLTRERPHDEKAWLDFVEFQDKVATMQPQKGARLQTLEKKISVLEKAAELNPENEQLLLALMSAYQSRDSTDVLIGRWEKILTQNSGSYKLWRQFLHVVQGEFSRFKVSELRKIYATATRALSTACSMQYRQANWPNSQAFLSKPLF